MPRSFIFELIAVYMIWRINFRMEIHCANLALYH